MRSDSLHFAWWMKMLHDYDSNFQDESAASFRGTTAKLFCPVWRMGL